MWFDAAFCLTRLLSLSSFQNSNFKMASIEEVADAFKESLQRTGKLGTIRASLRSEVFQCLQSSLNAKRNDISAENGNTIGNICAPPMEIQLCHSLILEYLQCNGLVHTLSTFKAETSEMFSRSSNLTDRIDFTSRIEEELSLNDDDDNDVEETARSRKRNSTVTDIKTIKKAERIPLLFKIVRSLRRQKRRGRSINNVSPKSTTINLS